MHKEDQVALANSHTRLVSISGQKCSTGSITHTHSTPTPRKEAAKEPEETKPLLVKQEAVNHNIGVKQERDDRGTELQLRSSSADMQEAFASWCRQTPRAAQ